MALSNDPASTLAPARPLRSDYDGTSPFPTQVVPCSTGETALRVSVTLALVLGPVAGLVLAAIMLWGWAFSVTDLVLAVVLYVVTGLGVTLGFHRGLTHGSFKMARPLQLFLTVAGSMAYEGGVIDWVATHRRHHAFTDRPGDPHSPYRYGTSAWAQTRGLLYAHVGWLLGNDPTSSERYAPDLLKDPMLVRVQNAFPWLCIGSLVLPFLVGFAVSGTLWGGFTAFVWAGLARVAFLQHVTWSVNSLCHLIGERPYATRRFDRATDFWPLAIVSFGESWHNGHHADPTCARHGRGRRQVDPSAITIRALERLGWVHDVRWPAGSPKPAVGAVGCEPAA
ncbi:MAG TPA: fatty acid desaturase [Actinomycetes bacterium]